jgi:hypothetical protein
MSNLEFQSAAADSEEEDDAVNNLELNREINYENDENTTQMGHRRTGVPN